MLVAAALTSVVSCKKDSNGSDLNSSQPQLSSFDGTIRFGDNIMDSEGVIEVQDGNFIFLNELGSMIGTVALVNDPVDDISYYEIAISQGEGLYENGENVQGELYNDYLSISGSSEAGEFFDVSGEVLTVEESNAQLEAARTKASFAFTNLENCDATITINGETLGPLHPHWREGGYCNTPYQDVLELPKNFDDRSSSLPCRDLTLRMLDGSYETFSICDVAFFIVDKGQSYSYTVSWENGESTSGTLSALTGGKRKYVCISNNGPDCEDNNQPSNYGISEYNFTVTSNTTPYTIEFNLNESNFEYSQGGNGLNSYDPYEIDELGYTGLIIEGLEDEVPGTYAASLDISMQFPFGTCRSYWPGETSDYTVRIEELDFSTGQVHLIFENVKLYNWENSQLSYFTFTGTLVGTFEP